MTDINIKNIINYIEDDVKKTKLVINVDEQEKEILFQGDGSIKTSVIV